MAVSKKEHVPLRFIELAEASLSISECNRSGILLRVISVVLFILHPTASRFPFQIIYKEGSQ